MVLDLSFDDNLLDRSGFNNHGTIDPANPPVYEAGKFGNALRFDYDIENGVTVADATSPDFGIGNFSICYWTKPEGRETNIPISKYNIDNSYRSFYLKKIKHSELNMPAPN